MNLENLEKLHTWLSQGAPERTFDMSVWLDQVDYKQNWCETTCCIAGWCYQQTNTINDHRNTGLDYERIEHNASHWLGLNLMQTHMLFRAVRPTGRQMNLELITPAQAAIVVRHLMETGEVNWDLIANE